MQEIYKGLVFIVIVLLLNACGGHTLSPAERPERLSERTQQFIEARENADVIALQGLYVKPGQARIGSIVYKGSEIIETSITEEGQKAEVKLRNTIQAMGFTFKKVPQTLSWVWHENDWFMVQSKDNKNPFSRKDKGELKDAVPEK